MKLGILGTGKIVQTLMENYDRLPVEKTYLLATPRSLERARKMAADHSFAGVFTDYKALLASDIDTVYVALPNDLHYEYTRQAFEAGKDVILEKPATSNLAELEALLALAEEKNCRLIEAMTVHHLPIYRRLKADLGKIGPIKLANLQFCQYSSRYDAFLQGIIHPVFDPEKCGGALYDLNVYNLHAALVLFGQPENIRYTANVARGIDTSGVLVLEYPDMQVVCTATKDCDGPNISTIHGEKGVIRLEEPLSRITGYTLTPWGGTESRYSTQDTDRMYAEFVNILDLLQRDDPEEIRRLQQLSFTAMALLEQARHQAGIRFPCDL